MFQELEPRECGTVRLLCGAPNCEGRFGMVEVA